MAASYGQINDKAIPPVLRDLLMPLIDRVAELERQVSALESTVLRTGSPISAFNQQIQNLANPSRYTDAVNLQTTLRLIQIYLNARAVGISATAPGGGGISGTPNPLPIDALPLYDGSSIVQGVFAANPDLVARSCQRSGGTWELMDALVDALRAADTRFAYNGKRGNAADPSFDAVSYDYGAVAGGEGSTSVYIVDVIAGHCGVSPSAAWQDVTIFAPGVWISRGRF